MTINLNDEQGTFLGTVVTKKELWSPTLQLLLSLGTNNCQIYIDSEIGNDQEYIEAWSLKRWALKPEILRPDSASSKLGLES